MFEEKERLKEEERRREDGGVVGRGGGRRGREGLEFEGGRVDPTHSPELSMTIAHHSSGGSWMSPSSSSSLLVSNFSRSQGQT